MTGIGSLVIAALAPLAGHHGDLLANSFWALARWTLVTALIVLPFCSGGGAAPTRLPGKLPHCGTHVPQFDSLPFKPSLV